MKKTLYILAALIAASSCSEKDTDSVGAGATGKMVEWTFEASYTRALINAGTGAFSWSAGDEIAVWNAGGNAFVNFATPAGSGKFYASAPADAHFTTLAFYPASVAASLSGISLPASYDSIEAAGKGFPMYAAVEEGSPLLSFRHLGAILVVNISKVAPEAVRMEISSTSSLSGAFALADNAGFKEIRAAAGSAAVNVLFSLASAQDISVAVPLPAGSYPVSIKLYDGGGNELFSAGGGEAMSFSRANLYNLKSMKFSDEPDGSLSVSVMEKYQLEDESAVWE